jgi:hypothetical protein
VGSFFRWNLSDVFHRPRVDYVDHARIVDGDIGAAMQRIEENLVRCTAQGALPQELARMRVEGKQHAGVAGVEQAVRTKIKVEPVGASRWNWERMSNAIRTSCIDDDNLRGLSNVYLKHERIGIVDRPTRAAGHGDLSPRRTVVDADD